MRNQDNTETFEKSPKPVLKIGDIISHSTHGLMVLIEDHETSESSLAFKLHGKSLFRMQALLGQGSFSYILYESSLDRNQVRLATDDQIIEALTNSMASEDISQSVGLGVDIKEGAAYLFEKDGDSFIYLTNDDLKKLQKKLNEIL